MIRNTMPNSNKGLGTTDVLPCEPYRSTDRKSTTKSAGAYDLLGNLL